MFYKQFQDVAEASMWSERDALLHLCSSLEKFPRAYGRGKLTQDIFVALQTLYDISTRQVKNRLLGLKQGSQGSVFDLAVDIGRLASLAHPYISVADREQITVECLICSMDSWAIQRHLLTADTYRVARTILTDLQEGRKDYRVQPVDTAGSDTDCAVRNADRTVRNSYCAVVGNEQDDGLIGN